MSITQLVQALAQKGVQPNRTTVYRIIDKLVQQKQVQQIPLNNGESYFEFKHPGYTHHHHFFCSGCETVYCLSGCHVLTHNINLTTLLPDPSFKIQSHDFNLYGTCSSCAA